jgi:hypothetical protein
MQVAEALEGVAAGYLLVNPVPRPAYASERLLPGELVSACDCICPQFPDTTSIDWVVAKEETRIEALDAVGLPPQRRSEARAWATNEFEMAFGWPGVFYTAGRALETRQRFFGPESKIKVVGLALPSQYVDEFIAYASPPSLRPGFAPQGESGYLRSVKGQQPLAPGAQRLGFELLDVEFGQIGHSWICNGLETHCEARLGVRPNSAGFIETLELAQRCLNEIVSGEVGAEPGLWLPWLLVEYG